jgi:RHH-type transcriptional regulator, rel operon repressor / antitoxin RelB
MNTDIQKEKIMATSIRLDASIETRLNQLAQTTGRSKAYYLRELITNGMDDLEDHYRAAVVMERVRKGEEKIYTLDEIEAELGLGN